MIGACPVPGARTDQNTAMLLPVASRKASASGVYNHQSVTAMDFTTNSSTPTMYKDCARTK
jgi:hypothetical protein